MKEYNTTKAIEGLADTLAGDGFGQLPDNTKLQKLINRLYIKLRICGMPAEEVSAQINALLNKHGITKDQVLANPPMR